MSRDWRVARIVAETAFIAAAQATVFYGVRYAINAYLDSGPPSSSKKIRQKGDTVLAQAGLSPARMKELDLDEYEKVIAGEIIPPTSIDVTFESVGGLDDIISELRETVIYPLTFPELFASPSGLLSAPRGVLLYGRPGCGKTMLAKAMAKESGATFINLPLSTLTNKWFGETNKLVNGVFSLAKKVQPTIIFIDEIDSLLSERNSSDHEVTAMLKAEFMTLWDGLTTATDSQILILGATNRPQYIDSAVQRRLPKRFEIPLPGLDQRIKILTLMLNHTSLSPDFSITKLAERTHGLSGSDLRETCRNAAMVPVTEVMRERGGKGKEGLQRARLEGFKLRPLTMSDFIPHDSHDYRPTNTSYGGRLD